MDLENIALQEALKVIQKDSILLHPSETLNVQSPSRRATLQLLLNRFYWQIRYGCQDPNCKTPTCLSCRRRVSKGPVRPFTILSAKALAAFLAEQENPEQALCSHPPAISESCFSDCQAAATNQRLKRLPNGKCMNRANGQYVEGHEDQQNQTPSPDEAALPPKLLERQKKDYKSISQSLFDTEAWWVLQAISHANGNWVWTRLPPWLDDDPKRISFSGGTKSKLKIPKPMVSSSTDSEKDNADALQVLSHFSPSNLHALVHIIQSFDANFEKRQQMIKTLGIAKPSFHQVTLSRQAKFWHHYAYLSMVHVLSNTDPLLNSFLDPTKTNIESEKGSFLRSLDCHQIWICFGIFRWIEGFPQRFFPSLWVALGHALASSELRLKRGYLYENRQFKASSSMSPKVLSGSEAAHIVGIAIAALNASVPVQGVLQDDFWQFTVCSTYGFLGFDFKRYHNHSPLETSAFIPLIDAFEDDQAMDLATRMVRVWMAHRAGEKRDQATHHKAESAPRASSVGFTNALIEFIASPSLSQGNMIPYGMSDQLRRIDGSENNLHALLLIEWLRRVIFRYWNGKADIERSSPAAGAIDWLSVLHKNQGKLGLSPSAFLISRFVEKMDPVEIAVAWDSSTFTDTINLLSFPFLFNRSNWISYFRAINHASMRRVVDQSLATGRLMASVASTLNRPGHRWLERVLLERMKPIISTFLVLDIRRDNILTDALNQLWRRDRCELRRPLRVKLGHEEGEQGVDAGGIQQEFFRLAMAEAFDPNYGLFTTDSTSQMSWFQPGSLEPLYKYELLGLLTSLAVYNGLTLPFTFPNVLYKKLLNVPLKNLWELSDGWPGLMQGLRELWKWEGDDVEQVFTVSFTFEAPVPGGEIFSIDLTQIIKDGEPPDVGPENEPLDLVFDRFRDRHCKSGDASTAQDTEPPMVTSENKKAFVAVYVKALIDTSIAPQFNAFRAGFLTVLSPKSLSLFSPDPSALKTLVEGAPTSPKTAAELKRYCKYENGFGNSPTIAFFWEIVEHEYDSAMLGKLLEFVTSSSRVPVQGVSSMTFKIQNNGDDESRLPTSSTCFGILLLPEYRSKDVLRERLRIALENPQGFGSV